MMRNKTEVTNRLTLSERKAFKDAMGRIFTRHLTSVKCPLTSQQQLDLWVASLRPGDYKVWQAMCSSETFLDGDKCPLSKPSEIAMNVMLDYGGATNPISVMPVFQVNTGIDALSLPWWRRTDLGCPVFPQTILPPEVTKEFVEWAVACVHTNALVNASYTVLENVLGLASTAGQLQRMVPEMVEYLDPLTKQALNLQVRQSPLPDEWMKVDRVLLNRAIDHLGLCYLLPEVNRGRGYTMGNYIAGANWAFVANRVRYPAGISFGVESRLSSYTLPHSSAPSDHGTWK